MPPGAADRMPDLIKIHGLRVDTHIGVSEEERSEPQAVLIDIDLQADLRQAGDSDELEHTIDYAAITSSVGQMVRSESVGLLEHLAEKIARVLLETKGVITVTVEIAKETPPVKENVDRIAVRIERHN